jgi:putative intracellular protease/amidase
MSTLASQRTLFVLTSHTVLGAAGNPTGFWFEELAAPWWALRDAGLSADIITISGAIPVPDPLSLTVEGGKTPDVDRFQVDVESQNALTAAVGRALATLDATQYEAVFLVGGHGTMWDFPDSGALRHLIERVAERGGIIAAVCHGSSALLHAKDSQGQPLVKGRKICAFANSEEAVIGATHVVPFLLEDELCKLGAIYKAGQPFQSNVVRDGNLLTGQNPQSSRSIGEMLVTALRERAVQTEPT